MKHSESFSSWPQLQTLHNLPPYHFEEVRSVVERLEGLIEQFLGKRPRSTPPKAWAAFFALPEDRRFSSVLDWKAQSNFLQSAISQGFRSVNEVELLRYAMGYLGLLGNTDLFERLDKDDLVEITDSNYLQIYRSYSFYGLTNYSLVELRAYPFFELYESSSVILNEIMARGHRVLDGVVNYANLDDLPGYTLRETMTDEGAVFAMREKFYFKLVSTITGERYVASVKSVKEIATAPSRSSISYI